MRLCAHGFLYHPCIWFFYIFLTLYRDEEHETRMQRRGRRRVDKQVVKLIDYQQPLSLLLIFTATADVSFLENVIYHNPTATNIPVSCISKCDKAFLYIRKNNAQKALCEIFSNKQHIWSI